MNVTISKPMSDVKISKGPMSNVNSWFIGDLPLHKMGNHLKLSW